MSHAALLPRPNDVFPNHHPVRPLSSPACTVVIDAEEDFDWSRPVRGTDHSTGCMRSIGELRPILNAYGIKPAYMLTYPVLNDVYVVNLLRRQYARGECELGVHLHTWVTPPFDGQDGLRASFLNNLSAAEQEQKLLTIKHLFQRCFGFEPVLFRAGRYGFDRTTAAILEKHGFTIDTSLAPRTDFHGEDGPDFSEFDCQPFWFGEQRTLLEVPLCRDIVGWGGHRAKAWYRANSKSFPAYKFVPSVLSRLRCAERVTVSPEGNDVGAILRFVRQRQRVGQTIFSVSFHGSSLAPGRNPYVQSRADLHVFYDRLSAALDTMRSRLGMQFTPLSEIPVLLGGSVI